MSWVLGNVNSEQSKHSFLLSPGSWVTACSDAAHELARASPEFQRHFYPPVTRVWQVSTNRCCE